MVDTRLIERLVERAVDARVAELEQQLLVQHWLLTEMVRELPRHALVSTSNRLDQIRAELLRRDNQGPCGDQAQHDLWAEWQLYLRQQIGLVEGDTPPPLPHGLQVPARRPRLL